MHHRRPQETGCPLSARERPLWALQLPVPGRPRAPLCPHGTYLEAPLVPENLEAPSLVLGLGGGTQGGLQGCLGWRHSTAPPSPNLWISQVLPGSAPAQQTAGHMPSAAKALSACLAAAHSAPHSAPLSFRALIQQGGGPCH